MTVGRLELMDIRLEHIKALVTAGLMKLANHDICEDDYDRAYEILLDDAPVVREYEAEQDKGAYSVVIRGVQGIYFIQAVEYDDFGPYETLSVAEEAVDQHFGEFLI